MTGFKDISVAESAMTLQPDGLQLFDVRTNPEVMRVKIPRVSAFADACRQRGGIAASAYTGRPVA